MTAALLNHLWQSTAFAGVAALAAWLLRGHQARARFWIWMAASLKFLVPLAALAAAGEWLGAALGAHVGGAAAGAAEATLTAVTAPFQALAPMPALPAGGPPAAAAASLPWAMVLGAVAAAGSAALLARWAWRWRRLARLAREARPSQVAGLRAAVTRAAVEPGVFGIWRPVLLLPEGLEARLSPAQLEAVVAHERCHLRRRDNFWSALHMLVETVFWFHPLVWWIGGKLVEERERACDESVLGAGGDREAYAGGLLAVCRYYAESPLRCAAGVSGGGLTRRVRAILDGGRRRKLSRAQTLLLAGAGGLALLGPLAAGIVAAPGTYASVKITRSEEGGGMRIEQTVTLRGRNVAARNLPLKNLIELAYGLQPYQVEGPNWIANERYNVRSLLVRKADQAPDLAALRPLLRQRFGLAAHNETRTMRVFVMRIAPDGPKLAPAAAGKDFFYAQVNPGAEALNGEATMPRLAAALSAEAGVPLLDGTGLKGNYTVRLDIAPRVFPGAGLPGGEPPLEPSVAAAVRLKLLAAALQQQLGLLLVPERMPVPVMIIDHIDKAPRP